MNIIGVLLCLVGAAMLAFGPDRGARMSRRQNALVRACFGIPLIVQGLYFLLR